MKTKILSLLLLAFIGLISPNQTQAQGVSVNFSVFYNSLGNYGRWIDNARYGRVWCYNEPGFRPYYTNGHWDYTEYGWTWISDYDWGWGPFHYGRWEMDPYYGWIWIPGYDWAPAWVTWSQNGSYYGWAPLGFGVNINVSIGSIPYDRWVFLPRGYINHYNFRQYCAPFSRNKVIIRNTTIINNYYGNDRRFTRGPDRRDVERYSHNRIEERRITNYGRNGDLVRRPERTQTNGNNNRIVRNRNANNGTVTPSNSNRVIRDRSYNGNTTSSPNDNRVVDQSRPVRVYSNSNNQDNDRVTRDRNIGGNTNNVPDNNRINSDSRPQRVPINRPNNDRVMPDRNNNGNTNNTPNRERVIRQSIPSQTRPDPRTNDRPIRQYDQRARSFPQTGRTDPRERPRVMNNNSGSQRSSSIQHPQSQRPSRGAEGAGRPSRSRRG